MLSHTNDGGVNKVILRYSDNSDNSVYNKTDGLTAIYASFEGSHKLPARPRLNTCWPSMTTTTARTIPITVKTTARLSVRCISGTTCIQPGWKPAISAFDYDRAVTTRAGS
ncbi:Uncharacterised protein [Raoultella terrigena]|uniref:Uncharacterized protein n=1 Tax=Raoultella terrigena TaxID=577 RepID=A0A3P8JFJ0_RAOTE|nr:Uncharacterised protein [Raoultella terrigena]